MADDPGNEQLLRYAQDLQTLMEQHARMQELYKRALCLLKEDRRPSSEWKSLALQDPLTGLANRNRLEQCMAEALIRAEAKDADSMGIYLLYMDLDQFKPINDALGHEAGDHVLKQVAQRLVAQIRHCDTVARVGGDEFVVLLENMRSRSVVQGIMQHLIEAVSQPIDLAGNLVGVGTSVGCAEFGCDGTDLAMLLRAADAAMFRAKRLKLGFCFADGSYKTPSVHRHSTQ